MALLSALVSQYELLRTLTTHLHWHDLVSLGLTSKEYWTYVGQNREVLRLLEALTPRCGRRQVLSEYQQVWEESTILPYTCAENGTSAPSKPCDGCGYIFCNACRFHLTYRRMPNSSHYEYEDEREWTDDEDSDSEAEHWEHREHQYQRICELVEARGCVDAREMMLRRWIAYCPTCILFHLPARRKPERYCKCTFQTRFVTGRWLCKHCAMAEIRSFNDYHALPNNVKGSRWKCADFKRRNGCKMSARRVDRVCLWCRCRLKDDQHPRNSMHHDARPAWKSGVVVVLRRWLAENPRPSPSLESTPELEDVR